MDYEMFVDVLDDDEKIGWVGRPSFLIFVLQGVPFLIIGIIWGIIDFSLISRALGESGEMKIFLTLFMVAHTFPCWGSILNIFRLILVHKNTYYAYTNKRVIIRTGIWGIDYKIIDYDKITSVQVNVNPIENFIEVGTIRIDTGNTTRKGATIYDKFIGIEEPYCVFKELKKISVDIKTDWNYPNAKRPSENPGYKTTYTRHED